MITGSALAIAVATLGSGAAFAGGMEEPGATQEARDKANSRRVCKMITPTSSRLAHRTCKTKGEWDREAAQLRQDIDEQRLNNDKVQPGAFSPG